MSSPPLHELKQFLLENEFVNVPRSDSYYPTNEVDEGFYLQFDYETNEHGTYLYVQLREIMNSKRLDHQWVYSHDFGELVDMLIKHNYAPTIRYHRLRMLNLLLEDEG